MKYNFKFSYNFSADRNTPFRAVTTAYVTDESKTIVSKVGHAYCSWNDQYVRRVGMKRALERAMIGLDKDVRTEMWKQYFAESENRKV